MINTKYQPQLDRGPTFVKKSHVAHLSRDHENWVFALAWILLWRGRRNSQGYFHKLGGKVELTIFSCLASLGSLEKVIFVLVPTKHVWACMHIDFPLFKAVERDPFNAYPVTLSPYQSYQCISRKWEQRKAFWLTLMQNFKGDSHIVQWRVILNDWVWKFSSWLIFRTGMMDGNYRVIFTDKANFGRSVWQGTQLM